MVWAILNEDQRAALGELIEGQKSDRIVSVIGGAILEDSLRRALELRMRPKDGNTDMNDKLFRVGGPLGNFGPKIDLGYQLYMFDKPYRNAMYGISEIRNLFAHNLSMTFASGGPKMNTALDKLALHVGQTHYQSALWEGDSAHIIEATDTAKDKILVNLKMCLLWLMLDNAKHQPWSNVPRR